MGDTVAQWVPCELRQACLIGGLNGVAEPSGCELNSSLVMPVPDSRRHFAGLLNCTPALQDTTNETVTRRSEATFNRPFKVLHNIISLILGTAVQSILQLQLVSGGTTVMPIFT